MSKLRSYRETIAKVQSVIRQKELDLTRERIYKEAPDSESDNRSHDEMLRQQVMRGQNVLEKTSQSLARSTQIAHENEEIGGNIINELGAQRETLERARGALQDTDAELTRSRRIIKRISRGTVYNKVCHSVEI